MPIPVATWSLAKVLAACFLVSWFESRFGMDVGQSLYVMLFQAKALGQANHPSEESCNLCVNNECVISSVFIQMVACQFELMHLILLHR